jgi:hypothetical protein
MRQRVAILAASLVLFGGIVISESFAINLTFLIVVLAYAFFVWYTRSAVLLYSGYLILSCWNLGNGFAVTNAVLDGVIVLVLAKRLGDCDISRWSKQVRVPLLIFLISGGMILVFGGKHSLNIVHLQLQGLFFGLLCSLEKRPILSLMGNVLRVFGAFLSLFCFIEAALSSAPRMEGPHESATAFGVALAMIFSFLFPADFFSRRLAQFTSFPILIGLISAIVLTGTRAALMAVVIVIFATLVLKFGKRISTINVIKSVVVVGAIVFGVWSLLPETSTVKQSFSAFSSGKIDLSAFGRLVAWKYALDYFTSAPFFGIGIGQFYQKFPEIPMIGRLQHAHSLYLNTLAETGLAGVIILATLMGVALHRAWRNRYNADIGQAANALLVCAISTLFLGCFDTVPYYPSLLGLAWFQYSGYLRLPNGKI